MVAFGLLAVGLVALVVGAEMLVRGASRLAAAAGVSSLAIGLTVVAYGTSAPEVAVSVNAALHDQADIALGNVVGSNTCNVLLILGISAIAAPLAVSSQLVRIDVPLMIAVSLGVVGLAYDGVLGWGDGCLLLLGAAAYTVLQLVLAKRDSSPVDPEAPKVSVMASILLVAFGLATLVLGSRWMVDGAVRIAEAWGVSQLVIGLTIVAIGTSLPELVTSLVASLRGERDIAVGNIVGSNLFNLTAVLGAAAFASPAGLPISAEALRFDLPVMVGVSVVCLPIFFTGMTINRWEGALLLAYYVAYVAYLVLESQRHHAAVALGDALRWFVLPMTALVLVTLAMKELRRRP
ncbi:Inner membrane protein YrbG [Botrimarina colliarenosi]|uniref:Inner membrane protein YrbG n=2 Tax=Botrimarina colliarenosi TaxID=2528001 RepID=A0A5C6AI83_9BACT|nr:Inner membrane protein YrbG [Botrimarina colliarenosi]